MPDDHLRYRGEPGPRGEKGEPGEKGIPGPPTQGNPGVPGARGERGAQGEVGSPGPRGDRGLTGEPGPRGDRGLPGVTGAPGRGNPATVALQEDVEIATIVLGALDDLALPVSADQSYAFQFMLVVDRENHVTPQFDLRLPTAHTARWASTSGDLTTIGGILVPTADGTISLWAARHGNGSLFIRRGSTLALYTT